MLTFECHGRIQHCANEMQASYLPKSAKLLEFRQIAYFRFRLKSGKISVLLLL